MDLAAVAALISGVGVLLSGAAAVFARRAKQDVNGHSPIDGDHLSLGAYVEHRFDRLEDRLAAHSAEDDARFREVAHRLDALSG